jgi:hypothetical protein
LAAGAALFWANCGAKYIDIGKEKGADELIIHNHLKASNSHDHLNIHQITSDPFLLSWV